MAYQTNHKKTKKGDYAETIVNDLLRSLNYQLLIPFNDGNGHLMDGTAYRHISRDTTNQQRKPIELFHYDVKGKPTMFAFNATGVDTKHYYHYKELNELNTFKIFFVDEISKTIYGNTLEELSKPFHNEKENRNYPYILTTKKEELILFPMQHMKKIGTLTDQQATHLTSLSNKTL